MALELIINTFSTDIENGEFNIAALIGGDGACDWSYSVGLHRCFGHPELLIVGLDAGFTGAILELLGTEVAQGRVIQPGEEVTVIDGLVMRTHLVDPLWRSMGEWFALGQAVMSRWGAKWPDTIQLLWADDSGRYPERLGDPYWMLRQPLLSAQHCNA
ncbi:MAG: DUF4262 domain-containing protein [Microthrixaceae bacterium]|nr:DUF4262 domain-containing protein [Microthrixaceae bacterium]